VQSYSYSYDSRGGGNAHERREEATMGPGGVVERRRTVRDGNTGEESVEVHRSVGGRGRTIKRMRAADGAERTEDQLHGLRGPDEAAAFDREWRERRAQGGGPRLGAGGDRLALPGGEEAGSRQGSRRDGGGGTGGMRWF